MHAIPAATVHADPLPPLSTHGVDLFAATDGGQDGGRGRPLRLDLRGDPTRIDVLSPADRRAIARHEPAVAVPLWGREHLLGVLLLGAPRSGTPIAQEDLDLLETLGEQAAIAIENALLHKSEIERERMAQELRVARGIQAHLVPNQEPKSDAVEFAGTTVASQEIGGDFYDYVPLADRRIGIAIGDVAGKGIPAALLMAGLQSSFRIEAERGRRPADVLATLNHRIHSVGERDRFVCFFYGLLDLPSRQLVYANAGLDPPILVRASGRVERLRVGGPVLGVMPGAIFSEAKVSLSAGDTLILYTDGLVEPAEVRSGFGEAELIDFLVANRLESPARLRELTLARLVELAGEMSYDDTTLIVARAR
jgi:sigma-B regulation protein RsbU (phosphoserine phosphatase)